MFERYVVGQHRPRTARTILILVSLALHGLAALALVVWSFFRVERIEPPPLTVTFFSAAAPPPAAAAPPAGRKNPTPKVKPAITQPKIVAPSVTQPKDPDPEPEPADDGEEDGADDGVTGGVTGGVSGGTVGGTVGGVVGGTGDAAPIVPPAPLKPKNVAPHQLDNEAIFHPLPHLPDVVKAQRRGMGLALFVAKICIAQSGAVQSVTVIQGIPGADDVVLATIKQWKYKPQAIPVCFVNNFEFDVQ